MSNQLSKPLYGQYSFVTEADRLATLANLGVEDSATRGASTAIDIADDPPNVPVDWSLGNTFTALFTDATATLVFSNTSEKSIVVELTGGAVAVAVTWPTVTWARGLAPANLAIAEKLVVEFTKIGATVFGVVLSRTYVGTDNARGVSTTLVYAATTDINWNLSNVFKLSIAAAVTLTFSNTSEKEIDLFIPVSGTRVITWPTMVWPGGAAPGSPADTKTGWYKIRKVGSTFYGNPVSVTLA